MNFENWRVKFKRVKIKRSWKLEVSVRCQVNRTGLWCGGEKKKTKWEELSIRPACEALKKRCERKLTQGDKNEGRSNFFFLEENV